MASYLIKDTTKEERAQIVADSLGNIDASCDGCRAGLAEMYQDYIDGKKEIREITMEFSDGLVHWTNRLDAKAKERGIKVQFIDMKEKGARGPVDLGFAPTGAETMSKGEFNSVCRAIGGYEKLIDQNCKDKDLLALVTYIAEEDRAETILKDWNDRSWDTFTLFATVRPCGM